MSVVLTAVLGMLTWSFAEYSLHHWVGHLGRERNLFSREHLTHHAKKGYFSAPWKKFAAAGVVAPAMALVAVPVAGWSLGLVYVASFVGMYLTYEWLHRRVHVRPPRTAYGRWARRHHFSHHFNCPKHNHGVTSPIWDLVFGTYQAVESVRVPARLALDWLVDSKTGEARDEFAAEYVITRPTRHRAAR